jgi:hypothetical protein
VNEVLTNRKGADAAMSSYPVKLVAVSGREQPVVLKVRRDGLWLYTEHGKVRCWAAAEPYAGKAVLHLQQ